MGLTVLTVFVEFILLDVERFTSRKDKDMHEYFIPNHLRNIIDSAYGDLLNQYDQNRNTVRQRSTETGTSPATLRERVNAKEDYPQLGRFDIQFNKSGEVPCYIVRVCHAPFKKSEIGLEIKDGVIVVSFDHKDELPEEGVETIHRGMFFASENFNLRLPIADFVDGNEIDENAITAKSEDGVLRIVLPVKKSAPPKSFKIKLG